MSRAGGRWFARRGSSQEPTAVVAGSWDEYVDGDHAGSRSYAVYTPAGLSAVAPVPLVVVLHGCTQSGRDAALGTDVNAFADRAGFVVLYPEQSAADNVRRCWNWFEPRHQARGFGEPAAIARITEKVLRRPGAVTFDRNRVHVMGLSAGGAMAGILAATYPDVYASPTPTDPVRPRRCATSSQSARWRVTRWPHGSRCSPGPAPASWLWSCGSGSSAVDLPARHPADETGPAASGPVGVSETYDVEVALTELTWQSHDGRDGNRRPARAQ